MEFADHYPAQCPPEDATPFTGRIFRFASTPAKDRDFLSHYDRLQGRDWGEKACQALGLSIFLDENTVALAQAAVPGMKKKTAVVANIDETAGLILKTPMSRFNIEGHYTWWAPVGSAFREFFTLGEE